VNLIPVLKLLSKAKEIHDYVKKPNNLDLQNDMLLTRLQKLEEKIEKVEKTLKKKKNIASEYKWGKD